MAYLQARHGIEFAPWVKVDLDRRSTSVTVGTGGAHTSINASGGRTTTAGAPGACLSIIDRHDAHRGGRPLEAELRALDEPSAAS